MIEPISWLILLVLSAPLVALAVYDIDVARELRSADRPPIPFLSLVKGIVYGVTIGGCIFAALGIQSAVFLLTQVRLLPPPLPLVVIYVGCVTASVAVYRLRRWIRSHPRQDAE